MRKKPFLLMILDGWGCRTDKEANAVYLADPVNFYALWDKYPHTLLRCSGKDVGLPHGQMGNSEVGHLNMGAGRVVYQEITRISNAIEDESFFSNSEFLKAIEYVKANDGKLHLMGLLSDGGVHSHIEHLFALLRLAKMHGLNKVYIHAFLDGRDVGPKTAGKYIDKLEKKMQAMGVGQIATIGGRFYGMDRDKRWERVEKAYNAMVLGEGVKAPNAYAALQNSYENRVTDEFMEPAVIIGESGKPVGLVDNGDSIIFFNFRADRARQITRAFTDEDFTGFERVKKPEVYFVCMTQYDITINAPVAFPPQDLRNTLGEVLSKEGLKQLRIAETEKYAHVTFFFNGGVEEPNLGEDRILIPSPKVATYNLKPEMSAYEVTDRVLKEIDKDAYDVIILNYANPDMVGHTGVLEAAIKAVQVVDECLGRVVEKVKEKGGTVIITADHGNCEMMVCPETGQPFTAHTCEKVPFILVDDDYIGYNLREEGALKDIAPTMLELLGIKKPEEMTGTSLLEQDK
ncbi:2,3-bisphosphoglycerate-independent phosphoglycerate mutase [Thermosyntropha sp.]|uniref:2,3-bisphosphoglycerate-independent phosphoglycerate mutase n=1 Tax=Thermosyntropha sp. TaxID=2740820 RepID=UPI0025D03AF3|nr:2,3-bisphosphoglycerate-independent phosphoglycerate mutase [Thermosyntropha sp.]MBO8158986.1 2,3-bisphosphoglycerate-independent phosphoglycerate mutase [Thermosyntropha sp.]